MGVALAFDPQREDYQRLGLRYAATLDPSDPAAATRAFANFGHRFSQNRDSLPQSDEDRAFHLVVMATSIIDYQLPFSTDQQAERLVERGHQLLDEALSLDAHCYDALRMKAAADSESFDAYYQYLSKGAGGVRAYCQEQCERSRAAATGERAQLAADIAMRPYVRWIATQAEMALICGRNREALRQAQGLLELNPADQADVRFSAALACAKLEDEAALDALAASEAIHAHRATDDGWMQLARIGLAYKAHDYDRARSVLDVLLGTYPHAAETLIRQSELPDGVFSRLAVAPYSEDELILAVSEGTVLLQEGRDPQNRGFLGRWLAAECSRRDPAAAREVRQMGGGAGDRGADDTAQAGGNQGGRH